MKNLARYSLDSKNMLEYIHRNLERGNLLSKAVLKHIDFNKGEFFTFLKKGLSENVVNQPKNMHVGIRGKEQIGTFLFNELNNLQHNICIFDDHEEDYKEDTNHDLYDRVGVHYNKEMYYIIQPEENNKKLIIECLNASDIIWHSLCIVSSYQFKRKVNQSISKDDLELIAKNAEIILVLAYDAQSYIIWKRNSR